ncbi:MAG TPA: penicillin-binding transpeptidase domain-containing protein [Solirubrobacterales bacterium]|jgi:cell division protein FtsI/penicillin-binding protein 2|nr:penicillin-binding transpeptidase domain-containing protein [Solirubrobacterales bacterium]
MTPEVKRRRRLVTRTLPLAIIAVVAFVVGAAAGAPGSPEKDTASRFAEAWAMGNFAAMYKELNPASKAAIDVNAFAIAYREADQVATLRSLEPGSAHDPSSRDGETVVPVPVAIATVAFGRLEDEIELPYSDGGIAWDPSLVFPGLRRGEHLENQIELAPRAKILAADGSPLAEGPAEEREHPLGSAAIDVTGEVGAASEEDLAKLARHGFAADTPVGISGLERTFNTRLAGKPGGSLLATDGSGASVRVLAQADPEPGAPVKTTIEPDLQEAAVSALAGRSGGIAVLDSRSGDVRALAGQAFSAPQPPGSTFKMITTVAALKNDLVSLDDEFEVTNGVNVGGRFLNNANGEYCGGTFRQAFAESCNADFAPLGPKIGNDELVATAESFGFNSPPTLYAPRLVREAELPESTIPTEIGEEIDLGVSAIGQGEVLATPLEMATVAQTIGNDGLRQPTSIVANKKLRPQAGPVRVMSKKLAGELTELMTGVVTEGTGTAGAIPEAQVAGKTGTAELGPKPGQESEENPVQIKDAWFAAFVPAEKARLAIGVLLIEAEAAGGDVAAPAAAEVLSAGL